MTNDQTRARILELWQEFALDPHDASTNEMHAFYLWLLVEHRSLVTWLCPVERDRWDDVRSWLESYGRRTTGTAAR